MPTATVRGHEIHYRTDGDEGPPIVMVHGVPTNSSQWEPIQDLLSPYFQTYAIDLIGMGKSDKPLDDWEYSWENDSHIIAELMDEWGHDSMIVAGDDWGGGIALDFAARYPDKTDICVAVDPVAYDNWPVAEIESIGRLAFIDDEEEFRKAVADFPMKLVQTLRTMVHEPSNFRGGAIKEGVSTARTTHDLRKLREPYETVDYADGGSQLNGDAGYGSPKLDAIRALALRGASLDPDWMLDIPYEDITAPTMLLWGLQDIMMDSAIRFRFRYDITNAPVRIQPLQEAGHLALVDQPHLGADAIIDFVTEHQGTDVLADRYMGFPEIL
ncbi:alpha/beta fold hydrolase [Haloplanus pelagicus]|uniref:alpha/beta fold hydrolase n=1 Tax=Haloplanus pelagicus TaxID=2949995 RepID=UPI00203A91EC|nr:alpha/beta hydrolase [Haloplanus sp. HW8-1]